VGGDILGKILAYLLAFFMIRIVYRYLLKRPG